MIVFHIFTALFWHQSRKLQHWHVIPICFAVCSAAYKARWWPKPFSRHLHPFCLFVAPEDIVPRFSVFNMERIQKEHRTGDTAVFTLTSSRRDANKTVEKQWQQQLKPPKKLMRAATRVFGFTEHKNSIENYRWTRSGERRKVARHLETEQ